MFDLLPTRLTRRFLSHPSKKRPPKRLSKFGEQLEARLMLTGPTANPDTYYDGSMGTISIPAYAGVLANDTGGSGPLSAVYISGPSHGTLSLNSDGSFTYTNTSFSMSPDTFTYKDWDGSSYSAAATVSIYTYGTYQPHAANDSYSVVHDHTVTVSASGVLANDTDPNGIHLTAVLVTGPSHGSLTLGSNGSISYTPATHFTGTDTFTYKDYDGNYYSSSNATVSISVTNTAPVSSSDSYTLLNGGTDYVSAASGVLANDHDADGDTLTATLYASPSHGSLTFNSDGSFYYTPASGWLGTDTFEYTATDGIATTSPTLVSIATCYGIVSATDQTKVAVDTIHVSQQLFQVPLVYDSVLAQPDAVIEADIQLNSNLPDGDTLSAVLTFNGVAQPTVYFNMNTMSGSDPHVHLAIQVDTSGLSSGRYAYSLVLSGAHLASSVTMTGAVNVVNDSSSPFGKGWDMPGLYRLFNNSVSGVPNGVLLSTGEGNSYYYVAGSGSSYTSPAGAFAFSTLTSVAGGWQLVTHDGTTYNFNSSGYLTSRGDRNGATTTFTWTSGALTAITDPFSRSIPLTYSSGLLASVEDYAGNTWTVARSGSNLTSISEPNPGSGSPPEWQFSYSGNYMSSATDPNGNVSSFTLNSFHRLSGTTQPDSSTTGDTSEQNFGYGSTSSGSPASLTMQTSVVPTTTDANGHTSSYETDQFGNVTYQVDPDGNATIITRDANGLPTQITLPPPTTGAANPVTNIYYDTTGEETYATGAQPTYGTYTYSTDSFGQWATFTDSLSNEWVRSFDSHGNILSLTLPSGAETTWTYDTYGQPLTMTQPAPNNATGTVTTHYYYDSYERLTEILWPDSTSQHFTYDSDDRRLTVEDENSHTTTTAYNVLGWVTSVTDAASGVTSATYDKDGNVLSTETPLGDVTSYEFNSMNELVQETLPDPDGSGPLSAPVLTWSYDANGNRLTSTNGLGQETFFSYNDRNQLTQETLPDPDGSGPLSSPVISESYDNLGREVTQTDALGGVTTTAYGDTDISQVTSVTAPDPDGSGPLPAPVTQYGYDADGRQNTVENAMGHTTTTTFTVNGQVASVEDPLSHTTSYSYGHDGELLSTTDPLSHATSYEYDSRLRLIQTTDANSGVTSITLDGVGNVTALVDPDSNETDWTYNALNMPLTETNSLGTTTTTYDADSDVTSIEDADGRVRDFEYDNDRQLTTENWMSGSTVMATMAYAYDAGGELTSASDANSANAFTFNGDGQLTSTDNDGTPGVPRVVLTAAYNAADEMTSQSATIAGTADFLDNYAYDADQRLTSVTQQDQTGGNVVSPKEIDYAYNALGEPTTVTDYATLSGPRTDVMTGAYSYDGGDRLTGLALKPAYPEALAGRCA